MYNKIILVGHLTRDIELRYIQSGSVVGNSAIATTKKFKSAMGEQREEILFVDIVFFGRTAEIANQYLRKGSKLLVDGRLKLDQWTAQDGTNRSKHSVVVENMQMLGSKDDMNANQPPFGGGDYPSQNQNSGYPENRQNHTSHNNPYPPTENSGYQENRESPSPYGNPQNQNSTYQEDRHTETSYGNPNRDNYQSNYNQQNQQNDYVKQNQETTKVEPKTNPQENRKPDVPEIDISEDEIPF